jgi:hypothetical protein
LVGEVSERVVGGDDDQEVERKGDVRFQSLVVPSHDVIRT